VNTYLTSLIVFGCLVGAVLFGRTLRSLLPQAHLSTESKDAMKLAIGLVATMSALVLGLLVSSAKGAYDTAALQQLSPQNDMQSVLKSPGSDAAGDVAQTRSLLAAQSALSVSDHPCLMASSNFCRF